MEFYDGGNLDLFLDGEKLNCEVSVTLNETMELLTSDALINGWRQFRTNLQSYSITVDGFDDGGYNVLRRYKRQRLLAGWVIQTSDLAITFFGNAYVENVERTSDSENTLQFSGLLVGFGAIQAGAVNANRLLEDGDARLLEDDDFRLLESGAGVVEFSLLENDDRRLLENDDYRILE